jgi:hypothetical protein
MVLTLPKGSLVKLNSTELSEHNRAQFVIAFIPIKTDNVTATGKTRRYFVAEKRTFSTSWTFLPAIDTQTVDGKAGRNSLKAFYDANIGTTVTLTYKEVNSSNIQTDVVVMVFIEEYQETLTKRWGAQYWDITLSLIEQ